MPARSKARAAKRPVCGLPKPAAAEVCARLLRHFRIHARDLPWRRTTDPYAIWLAETMLQQTQVATVLPYYRRWMSELPDLRSVARAPLDRLLQLWAGLGYYSRPRRFQEAARAILENPSGEWPANPQEWESLPGVGRYTAGAICSIAFNQPAPIVDGNITRVLCRVWTLAPTRRFPALTRRLWELAGELVQAAAAQPARGRRNCSDLNQALMELGALVCTPRQPHCDACPLADLCGARALGSPTRFPRSHPRAPATRLRLRITILDWCGRTYLERQTPGNWNNGLWQFPTTAAEDRENLVQPRASADQAAPLFCVRHTITRHRIEAHVFHLRGRSACQAVPPSHPGRWHRWEDVPRLALPGLHRKIYERWMCARAPDPA